MRQWITKFVVLLEEKLRNRENREFTIECNNYMISDLKNVQNKKK